MTNLPNNIFQYEDQKSELQKRVMIAMQRAAEEARKIAIQTNTAIVIKVDGKIKQITAAELSAQNTD